MAARSYCRGWDVVCRNGQWVYVDTGLPCWGPADRRPCRRCNREPTPEGHDACLGTLRGVATACCGHGVHEGWITREADLAAEEG